MRKLIAALLLMGGTTVAGANSGTYPIPHSDLNTGRFIPGGPAAGSGRAGDMPSTLSRRQLECLRDVATREIGRMARPTDSTASSKLRRCFSSDLAR